MNEEGIGYPNTCEICLEDESECSERLSGWRSTVFGKNFCDAKKREEIDRDETFHDYIRSKNCGSECLKCEFHNECESGCCFAVEVGDVKRCRDKCYDEFNQPLFADSNESVAPKETCKQEFEE